MIHTASLESKRETNKGGVSRGTGFNPLNMLHYILSAMHHACNEVSK